MIQPASKYGSVRLETSPRQTSDKAAGPARTPTRAPAIFVPTVTGARSRITLRDWYWKEIKEGGFLHEYLRREKARTPQMLARVRQLMSGFQQNNKSDFRLLARVPARLYQRWKAEDKHFFEDDNNLRSLRRDNPDACVYV